jgi:hypothetical protein
LIIFSICNIGTTESAHPKTPTKNLFLFNGLSSIYEKIYAQITIGKNEIKANTI